MFAFFPPLWFQQKWPFLTRTSCQRRLLWLLVELWHFLSSGCGCVCVGGGAQLCEKQDTAPGKELAEQKSGRNPLRLSAGGRSETTACLHAVLLLHSGRLSFTGSPSRTLSTMSLSVRPVRRPTSITRSQSFTGVNSTDKLPYRCVCVLQTSWNLLILPLASCVGTSECKHRVICVLLLWLQSHVSPASAKT